MHRDTVPDGPVAAATHRIVSKLDPAAVVLFGSRAQGQSGPNSDYDVAVLAGAEIPGWEAVRALQADLETDLAAAVDLVVLESASPILAMQVLREGRLLACRDPEALENFTVRTLTDYADLKIVRREAERRLLESRRP